MTCRHDVTCQCLTELPADQSMAHLSCMPAFQTYNVVFGVGGSGRRITSPLICELKLASLSQFCDGMYSAIQCFADFPTSQRCCQDPHPWPAGKSAKNCISEYMSSQNCEREASSSSQISEPHHWSAGKCSKHCIAENIRQVCNRRCMRRGCEDKQHAFQCDM